MHVNAAVVFASDRRPNHIHDAKRACAATLRFTHGGQRVCGFPRLRDHDAQCRWRDDRIAVAILRCVFNFNWNAAQLFDHHFANQRRVPARATGGDGDVVDLEQLFLADIQSTELGKTLFENKPPTHRVLDGHRLLEDLLEHEMRITAALDLLQVPLDAADRLVANHRVEVDDLVTLARDHGDLTIIEVHDLSRVRENR